MKKIMFIALIAFSSTTWGQTRISAGKEGVVATFDYNGKTYKQTLSIEALKQTQGFDPLEDSIDLKAIANAAIKKANKFNPDMTFSVLGVDLSKLGNKDLWYIRVSIGEPIAPGSQKILPAFTIIFSVSGASSDVVVESK